MKQHVKETYQKSADKKTQLEIDEGILEYLIYCTTKDLLRERGDRRQGTDAIIQGRKTDLSLQNVDCWSSLVQMTKASYSL